MFLVKFRSLVKGFVIASALMSVPSLAISQSVQPDAQRLLEASRYLANATQHLNSGNYYAAEDAIRVASYRVRIAKINLQNSGGSYEAVSALEVAGEKLTDPGLRADEKIYFGFDCIGVALKALYEYGSYYGNEGVLVLMHFAELANEASVFEPIAGVLQAAIHLLYGTGSHNAISALQVAIEKVQDRWLSASEKQFYVKDCIQVAKRSLGGGQGGNVQVREIYCGSETYGRTNCVVPGRIVRVDLARQSYPARCFENSTYGFYQNAVWVQSGCRAVFRVTYTSSSRF